MLTNIRSNTYSRQLEMQQHEHSTFEDDVDTFNFLTVAFDPVTPENDELSSLLATPVAPPPTHDELSPLLATPVALPPAHDTTRIEFSGFDTYEVKGVIEIPGAPVMKDLDSFTEGTGAGSFADLIDQDDSDKLVLGTLLAHPEPCNPNTSIMAWIEDVRITHQTSESIAEGNAPWVGCVDLPEDPLHMEALEATEALLEDFIIDADAEDPGDMSGDDNGDDDSVDINVSVGDRRIPSPSYLVPPMSAPPTAMTPRLMKRARSRSPASQTSRHVRSKSLSRIHSLPRDLTALPPWRSNHPFKDK
ncbi:hypothetical protein J132_07387 [Termitomyces sp. J132]|nr:hypothetical protein H2248_012410 [Termitomyces sp. 'cryptogamus']KNZ80099.1 hypothetical protein J132_07387 [Termitomyces sp. J132]